MAALGKRLQGEGGTAGAGQPTTRGGKAGPSASQGRGGGVDRAKPRGEGQTAIVAIVDRESQQQASKTAGVRHRGANRHD
jgi:hypothetical protein